MNTRIGEVYCFSYHVRSGLSTQIFNLTLLGILLCGRVESRLIK
jgi:hypothetical protein